MIVLYLISVLVCAVVFAAIAATTQGLPEHKTECKVFAVMFFTLCPVINTIVMLISALSVIAMIIGKFK